MAVLLVGARREEHDGANAGRLARLETEPRSRAVDRQQPRAHMLQSGARTFGVPGGVGARVVVPVLGQAQPAVVDADLDARVDGACRHLDVAGADLGFEPVPDRAFHQRLQQHRRHRGVIQRGRQVQPPAQPGPHAQRHDLEVGAQLGELAAERHRFGPRRGQRPAQVDDQPVDHRLGAVRVLAHQPAQVGQRVEQHVRFELRAQQAQPRLDRQALRVGARGRFPGQVFAGGEMTQPDATHQHGEEDGHQADVLRPDQAHRFAEDQEGDLVAEQVAGRDRDRAGQQPALAAGQLREAAQSPQQHAGDHRQPHAFGEDEQPGKAVQARHEDEQQGRGDRPQHHGGRDVAHGAPRRARPQIGAGSR
jgi:hypothetical protein